tara:strand:+ start:898 stop:1161 length:264 start_codon:yes stop_codon:yes gene_type:complete
VVLVDLEEEHLLLSYLQVIHTEHQELLVGPFILPVVVAVAPILDLQMEELEEMVAVMVAELQTILQELYMRVMMEELTPEVVAAVAV